MQIHTAYIPELAVRPAGAPMIPTRPWSQLSDQEKAAIIGLVVDRHARGMGSPQIVRRSADGPATPATPAAPGGRRPIPSELAGTITQAAWDAKTEDEQVAMLRAARDRAAQQSTAGFTFGTNIANAARDIVTEFMRGDTQRELANITATSRANEAQGRAESEAYVARTNLQIAEVNAAAARARSTGDTAGLAQLSTTLQGLLAAQAQAQNTARPPAQDATGLSTGAMVGIGVGALLVVGLGVFAATRGR